MPARGAVKRLQRLASSSICSKVLDTFHELEEEGVAAWADQLQALLARHLQPNLYQVILWSNLSFLSLTQFAQGSFFMFYFFLKGIGGANVASVGSRRLSFTKTSPCCKTTCACSSWTSG